jgi:general secretion pathway protein M
MSRRISLRLTSVFAPLLGPVLSHGMVRWQAASVRDRRALMLAGLVLGLYLLWALGLQPALRTLRTAPDRLAELDGQLQQMQRLAQEAGDLRQLPPISTAEAEAALHAASTRLGPTTRLQTSGDRITVSFTEINPADLQTWLSEVRGAARARVIEATLQRAGIPGPAAASATAPGPAAAPVTIPVNTGLYSGTIVLQLSRKAGGGT